MARQLSLMDLLGDRGWFVDTDAGMIMFGEDLRFPIQLLGTEGERAQTWLWAWANTQSGFPPGLLRAANWLREYGRQHHIPELTEGTMPLDRVDGHLLSLLAAGLTGHCYYRGPYSGGAVFLLLESVPDVVLAPVRPERVVSVLGQVISTYELEHRTVVESFLGQQGWHVETTATAITGRHFSGSDLRAEFDGQGRIADLQSTLRAG
ncbi:hypothetical protein J2S55_007924 [Streptosporangium brasiliense]|uniref:Uncharacterized protein n=2 Tax=Streptosporangiaceae TaxID=2004 RepID=A0ABT9RHV2_9ACTN|nr:DUF6882 domain-containing protein [Streptosporangium brasiliense]MDP9868658.1 hypothetical protein [Streptosporangium brasiliense]